MKANKISIIALVAVVIVIIGFIATAISPVKTPAGEIDGKIEFSADNYFSLQDLHKELLSNEPTVCFMDMRNADLYEINHLKGAKNIPLHQILNHELLKLICKSELPVVLVAATEEMEVDAWLVLRNAGIHNASILAGGYDFVRKNIVKTYQPKYNKYYAEKAQYDYSKFFSNSGTPAPAPKPVMLETTPVQGGC